MSQVEVVTQEEWPLDCRALAAHRELYVAVRKLALHPERIVRFPLNGVNAAKAAKKAHWYFSRHTEGGFRLQTATEDGFMYLRRAQRA
jgi:hypothetical protein